MVRARKLIELIIEAQELFFKVFPLVLHELLFFFLAIGLIGRNDKRVDRNDSNDSVFTESDCCEYPR
jgi:hypothetical protein